MKKGKRTLLKKAVTLACLEIRKRNEEAINSTRNSFFSLPTLSTVGYSSGYFLFVSYSTMIEYACINTRKTIPEKLHHCQRPKTR